MARVLVTGGTGFIGSHIVTRLVAKGHSVSVLSRDPARARNRLPAGVRVLPGDVSDYSSLLHAMVGQEAVINAVQFPNHPVENRRKGYTYMQVDGEGTVRQVKAAREAGVRRFVYVSGAGAREGRTEPWFQAKALAEKAVRESGLAYSIFRPSWVYGPDDRTLNKFVTFARLLPFIPVVGNGATRVQPVLVDDVAEAVAASIEMDRTAGMTYEIGGPQALTMDEIIRTLLQAMGKRRPLVHHPRWFMKLATMPMALLPQPPLSPAAVDFVLMQEHVDNGPLLRDFGIRLTPLTEGLSYLPG